MERVLQKAITHAYALNSITYSHNHQFHNQKTQNKLFHRLENKIENRYKSTSTLTILSQQSPTLFSVNKV